MNSPGHNHHHITMSMSKLLKLCNTQYRKKKETKKQLNCNIYPLVPLIPDLVHAEMAANRVSTRNSTHTSRIVKNKHFEMSARANTRQL